MIAGPEGAGDRRRTHTAGHRALVVLLVLGSLGLLVVAAWPKDTPAPVAAAPFSSLIGTFEGGSPSRDSWQVDPTSPGSVQVVAEPTYRGVGALQVRSAGTPGTRVVHPATNVVAGHRYGAAAFGLPIEGSQRLRVEFLDAKQHVIGSADATASPTNTWSRVVSSARAPAGSHSARVVIEGTAGSPTEAVWDDVRFLALDLPNGGVEAWSDGIPVGWSVSGGSGYPTVERTSTSHGGTSAVRLAATSSGDPPASIRTAFVQVVPDVEHRFRSWVRASSPLTTIETTWYDSRRSPIRSASHVVSTTSGEWAKVSFTDVAPSGAELATMSLRAPTDGAGEVIWDDQDVAPTAARAEAPFTKTGIATLSGFMTTTAPRVITVSGRAKLVTIVWGNPATVQMVDLGSGRLEHRQKIPGLTNGWALTVGRDGHTLFLSGDRGHLVEFDSVTRTLTDLGRATPQATHVFGLATGVDGRIWGASYPEERSGTTTRNPLTSPPWARRRPVPSTPTASPSTHDTSTSARGRSAQRS